MTAIEAQAPAESAVPAHSRNLPKIVQETRLLNGFDFSRVPEEHRQRVETATASITTRRQRMASDAYFFGNELCDIKGRLEHGLFVAWVEGALSIDLRTAERLMLMARRIGGKIDSVSNLPVTVLYDMTRRSVSDDVLKGLRERAKAAPLTMEVVRTALRPPRTPDQREDASCALELVRSCLAGREDELAGCLTPSALREITKHLRSLMNSTSRSVTMTRPD